MTRCVAVELIPWRWGGGHMCTGPCGAPHLHRGSWRWWRCPNCEAMT